MAKKTEGKILVNGSVVIDTILEKEFFGGTGANISYGLGKLKTSPLLFSLAGEDFKKDYGAHLKKSGVILRVHIEKMKRTASFSLINNEGEKQIWILKRNAYKNINKISLTKTISENELKKISIAIFSPGTPDSILKHMREFRNHSPKATVIFDPGQEINNFSKKILEKCASFCDIFIVNENEYAQAKKILKQDPTKVFNKKIIIKTLGEKGSIIFQDKKITKVPAVHPKKVVDTTGAGDAYRAGLIFGLWKGFSLTKSCTLGAKMAAINIEHLGCQKY